jgi:hypothetical protein
MRTWFQRRTLGRCALKVVPKAVADEKAEGIFFAVQGTLAFPTFRTIFPGLIPHRRYRGLVATLGVPESLADV